MEALHLHSNSQSHWSSGWTVCFPPMGAAVRIPWMHPHLLWNWVLLLAMSRYISDPDMTDHWPQPRPLRQQWQVSLGHCANNMKSWHDHTSHALPGSILLLAGPPPPRNIVTGQSPGQLAGGGGIWRPWSFTTIHNLTGPVGQPFASCPGGSSSRPRDAPTLTMELGSPVWCLATI